MSYRPLIYVAGRYSADTREQVAANILKAQGHGHEVLLAGFVPIVPHAITAHAEELADFSGWQHEDWLKKFCYPLLRRCDAAYFVPGWEESAGAKMEMEKALYWNIPVVFNVAELTEVI